MEFPIWDELYASRVSTPPGSWFRVQAAILVLIASYFILSLTYYYGLNHALKLPSLLYIHILILWLILTEEAKLSDCIIQWVFDCSDIFMTIQILVLPNFDCSGEEGTGLCESVTNVANAHDILFLPDPIFGSVICLYINWINKSFPELYTSMSLIIHISFTPILNFCSFSSFSFQNLITCVCVCRSIKLCIKSTRWLLDPNT